MGYQWISQNTPHKKKARRLIKGLRTESTQDFNVWRQDHHSVTTIAYPFWKSVESNHDHRLSRAERLPRHLCKTQPKVSKSMH